MEIEKKHILKSYKNEQEAIDSIEMIKAEKDNPVNSSISGYNVEKKSSKEPSTNAFSPGELDKGDPVFKDYIDAPTENTGVDPTDTSDIERPLPEWGIHNRIR